MIARPFPSLALVLALVFAPLAAALPAVAQAQETEIVVGQGATAPLPIAIPSFTGAGPHGAELAGIVRNNLDRSGFFAAIDPARFPAGTTDGAMVPAFEGWRAIAAQYLVTGQVVADPDGRLRVDFRLWDVGSQAQVVGLQFVAPAENWRRVGHKISDAIYKRLTGEDGYFDTRIIFVSESGPKTQRRRVLTLMDQDGANAQYLTDGSAQIFTPRFSSTSQEITYMALRDEGAQLYLFNIETGRQESLGRYPGMVFAPRFSPDGGRVAFSLERGGNSDIHIMNLRSRALTRLTSDPGIDTSPSFNREGTQIVFNSDRGGSPQLYVMNADGSGQRRISRNGGRYSTPVWSPKGDYIAFTKQTGSQFHIGIMRPDGSDERLLTTSFLDEGPTWAPNGRVLMFFRETSGGASHLWTVDLAGHVRQSPHGGSGSDPAWSPLLD
jgi:TolB protein